MDVARYVAVAALLPALVGGTGYLVLARFRVAVLTRQTLAPGLAVLVIAALSSLSVAIGVSGKAASLVIVALLLAGGLAAVLWTAVRGDWAVLRPSRQELPAFAIFVACYAFLAGFNLIPSNPPASISPCAPVPAGAIPYAPVNHPGPCAVFAPPSLTMSRLPHRSIDDLLQFRVTQAVWNRHLYTERDFAGGWRLQDRTPLLGVVTAGLGSAAGVSYPDTYPPQLWFSIFGKPGPLWLKKHGAPSDSSITIRTQPSAYVTPGYRPPLIDDWGYWFYRLLTIFLCSLLILPVYELAKRLAGARAAVLASVAAGLTPAIMQNAYYSSPKYLGVYFGLCALVLVLANRVVWAGAGMAAAYLCHPMSVLLAGPVLAYAAVRNSFRRVVVAGLLAAVLVVPWIVFASSTARPSSLISHPLGCVGPAVHVDDCLDQFVHRPTSNIAWQRVVVIPQMVLPFGIDALLPAPGRTGLAIKWMTIHDFSFPGMVGFVFFAMSVYGLWRAWRANRAFIFWIVGGQLAFILLFWGLPAVAAWVAGLGLLPFIFIFGAVGLLALPPRAALVTGAIIAAEWLLYLRALYYPIDGVSAGQYAVGWLLIASGILFMLGVAYAALVRGWPEQPLRTTSSSERPARVPA